MPALRYRNVPAAIDWLCTALGFEKHHVATAKDGAIAYAQLTFGDDIVMLSPVRSSDSSRLAKQFDALGGAETQSCYFVVQDADAHYRKAKAAGADIVADIRGYEYGGRGYSCRDPEGHIWNFGTYDPWQAPGTGGTRSLAARRGARTGGRNGMVLMLIAGLAIATIGWLLVVPQQRAASGVEARHAAEAMAQQHAREAADAARRQAAELARVESARSAAEQAAQELRERLAREESAREAIARNAMRVQQQLASELGQVQSAKLAALQAAQALRKQLAREESARQTAERSAQDAEQRLAQERAKAAAAAATGGGVAQRAPEAGPPIAPQPATEVTRKGEAREYADRTATEPIEDAASIATNPVEPATDKAPQPIKQTLSPRDRERRAERARARCRKLFPYSPCE